MTAKLKISRSAWAANLLSTSLIVGGFAAILIYGWMRADETVYQVVQQGYFAQAPTLPDADVPDTAPLVEEKESSLPVSIPRIPRVLFNTLLAPDPKAIGKLLIPKLNVDAVIREGTDAQTLRRALGHIPSTALPGRTGNFVVTGHRDTFFRPLRNIRKDDEIVVVTSTDRYRYQVYAISVVGPDQVQVLDPTREPECTLVTCFPFDYVGRASRRFIVQARLIEGSASHRSERIAF